MSGLFRFFRKLRISLLWLAAAVLAGLLLHIGAVLAITHFGQNSAVAAWSELGQVNTMTVLPPVSAGHQPLPFLSPTERYAVCKFDLRKGPVALHVVVGSDDWEVAIFGPTGANVYAVTGADLERHEFEILLATSSDGRAASLPIAGESGVTTAVGLAARTGIAVISAPTGRSANDTQTERLLSQASCTPRAKLGAASG